MRLKWRHFELDFDARTCVMGVVNVTPDSFSDGGRYADPGAAVRHARELAAAGADILDVGGESSRPGSDPVGAAEERDRVLPVIEALAGPEGPGLPVSVDTTKAEVADAAFSAGASMLNDISALNADADMGAVAARHGAPVILMHMRGRPKTMQHEVSYDDLFGEILAYLGAAVDRARAAGIPREHLLIDPGIGFGKKLRHNLELIRGLERFRHLGLPIVLGPSRKSFLGMILDLPVEERLEGTAAAVAIGIAHGADIIRVHDVAAMVRVARVADALVGKGRWAPAGQPA